MSIHDKFKEIEDLITENWTILDKKRCCADHSYVFQDLCEVHSISFIEVQMQTLDILFLIISHYLLIMMCIETEPRQRESRM